MVAAHRNLQINSPTTVRRKDKLSERTNLASGPKLNREFA